MLCQFTVKNFRCIKDEMTLDMQATELMEKEGTVLIDKDGEKFLPLGVIYGPNASGKSTILLALYSLVYKIIRPLYTVNKGNMHIGKEAQIEPFKFSKESSDIPTEYELFFRTEKYEYQYELSVLKGQIFREVLSGKGIEGNSSYATIFDRREYAIELKDELKNCRVEGISKNLTLLSLLGITYREDKIIGDVINWIENSFCFIDYGNSVKDVVIGIEDTEFFKNRIIDMLAEMDIDISDYRIERNGESTRVFTTHSVGGQNYELELIYESTGTIKILGLLPYIAKSIEQGVTLVIDELDAKLHPLLLKYIINLYRDKNINRKNAQLIFTSHDLTTMDSETFRRDEIWFMAKGEDCGSKLYSLVEFQEDKQNLGGVATYSKKYLEGHYGADPYFKRIIMWGDSK